MTTAEQPTDLDDILGPPIDDEELDQEPPHIEDQLVINRRLRRMAVIDGLAAEKQTIADANRAQIDAWLARELVRLDRERSWCERQVEGFMRWYARVNHVKSLKLPHGTPSLRAPRAKIEVTDEDAFTAYAFEHAPELVRVRLTPDKLALSKVESSVEDATNDAEGNRQETLIFNSSLLPGVMRVTPAEDTFSVKLGGDNE